MSEERPVNSENTPEQTRFQSLARKIKETGTPNGKGAFYIASKPAQSTEVYVAYWPATDGKSEVLQIASRTHTDNPQTGTWVSQRWIANLDFPVGGSQITPTFSIVTDAFRESSASTNHGHPPITVGIPEQSRELAVTSFLNWMEENIPA
jgi:hypothetical protein